MQIKNVEGLSTEQIRQLVQQGGKFVMYKYCISIIVMTFNNPTAVYFVKPGDSRITPGLGFLFVSLILGWWGIPWGPIYTIGNIYNVLNGGTDVTAQIMGSINQNDPNYGAGTNYNIPGQSQNNPAGSNTYNVPSQAGSNTYNIPR